MKRDWKIIKTVNRNGKEIIGVTYDLHRVEDGGFTLIAEFRQRCEAVWAVKALSISKPWSDGK